MRKVQLHVMLVLYTQCDNETIKCKKKKIKVPLSVKKIQSNVLLVPFNVTIELSNMSKK